MNEDYLKKFEAISENLELEKLYDQLAERADIVTQLVLHTAHLYKTAVEAGLPEAIADRLALKFYDSEMVPVTVYQIDGEVGGL